MTARHRMPARGVIVEESLMMDNPFFMKQIGLAP
jgi:hypothetical protein